MNPRPERNPLDLRVMRQPDDTTCGPTSLQAVYRWYGDTVELGQVVAEVPPIEGGGTLGALLGCHALRRGFAVRIYTYNLQVVDPTWFGLSRDAFVAKLRERRAARRGTKLARACAAYLEFLELGGELLFEDLTPKLLRSHLKRGRPIVAGLSATYLYRDPRERGHDDTPDDVAGDPVGHFVVLSGYRRGPSQVAVADPLHRSGDGSPCFVNMSRLVCALLLGVLTFDGSLLVIEPRNPGPS